MVHAHYTWSGYLLRHNAMLNTGEPGYDGLNGTRKIGPSYANPSYTYDEYLICIRLGPSISSVICKNPSYSGPSYPSSPVLCIIVAAPPASPPLVFIPWYFSKFNLLCMIHVHVDSHCQIINGSIGECE